MSIRSGGIGHVDHGTTTLADAIRRVNSAETETLIGKTAEYYFPKVDYEGKPIVRSKGKNKRWPRKW